MRVPKGSEPVADEPAVVHATDLSLSVREPGGARRLLGPLTFGVEPGKILGLIGRSGAGKTLLCKALAGERLPRPLEIAGSLTFDDTLGDGPAPHDARRYVPQDPHFGLEPHRTLAWHLRQTSRGFGPRRRDRSRDWLQRMQVSDPHRLASSYPGEVSLGALRQLQMARALAAGPRLLVLDDATRGLDIGAQAALLGEARQLTRQGSAGVVLVCPNPGLLTEFADRLIVLHEGRIVDEGPCATVVERPRHPYTHEWLYGAPSPESAALANAMSRDEES